MWKITLCVVLVVWGVVGCSGAAQPAPSPEDAGAPVPPVEPSATGSTPTTSASPTRLVATAPPPTVAPLAQAPTEPALFAPGVVSTEAEEWSITFTPDGQTAYFARSDAFFPQSRQATILETHWQGGQWSEPRPASFSGEWSDIDPFIAPDGSRLFFSSIRPVAGAVRADLNVWMVERVGEGWSEPIYLGDALNSPADELYPAVAADGTLYFASDRPGGTGGWDIYRAVPDEAGVYQAPENLGPPINTSQWEFNPFISPDGSLLLFTRLSNAEKGSLYLAYFQDGVWGEPVPLGPLVNTSADEYHPRLSPQGDVLFFVRRTQQGDIYHVQWASVQPE